MNEKIEIQIKKPLLEYEHREYISTLVYSGQEMLEVGDLPMNGELKHIYLTKLYMIKGKAVPYGVETLKFNFKGGDIDEPLSEFPSTLHSIKNLNIKNIKQRNDIKSYDKIPPNITSISFVLAPNISADEHGEFMPIPNTIKKLKFGIYWYNNGIVLKKGDIPKGITKLSLGNYSQIYQHGQGVLPNSIKHLRVAFGNSGQMDYSESIPTVFLSNFFPSNLETLELEINSIFTPFILKDLTSIKKLSIILSDGDIEPNSLPPNITHLTITNISYTVNKGVIPNGVTILKLLCIEDDIDKSAIPRSVTSLLIDRTIDPKVLPSSLKHLELYSNAYDEYYEDFLYSIENVNKMFNQSSFPLSLISITLPISFKEWDLAIPDNITNIKYKNDYRLKKIEK